MFPNFRALIIRRTIPDLRKSHLNFIDFEAKALGGSFNHTLNEATFPNGSKLFFTHCQTKADIMNFLSSEWGFIGLDELSTFDLEMFLLIGASARVSVDKPYKSVVRTCSNPLGPGAPWMKSWFVDHDVNLADYPDYLASDYETHRSTLDDNKYVSREEYEKRLKNLPEHVRKAWLDGEFVIEGAYFTDFAKRKVVEGESVPWHTIPAMPTLNGKTLLDLPWVTVCRSVDWGYHPDPAVCHWHIVLPNKRKITFKERTWTRTLAADVAADIKHESRGMRITDSFCDPTMFIKTGNAPYSIGEIFEQNGVPLTASQNDRELYGYAIHEMLNTMIDERPSWQIVERACPDLVRTLPLLQMDAIDPRKIADGPDHWAISCAYFAMGGAAPSRDPAVSVVPQWMRPHKRRSRLSA
jgi:phage terminase large subunit